MTRFFSWLVLLSFSALPMQGTAETLTVPPPLADFVDAIPRLNGDTKAAASINAALAELDREQIVAMTCGEGGDNLERGFRHVDILSDGPVFLSLVVSAGASCEAQYPGGWVETWNFDLSTGARTDLTEYLPDAWTELGRRDPMLFALYLDSVDETALEEGCLDVLARDFESGLLELMLGIDTASGRLMILPEGLIPVESQCEEKAMVPVAQLRKAGFLPLLIQAVEGSD